MRISENFYLSPFNREPGFVESAITKLDSYFYLGGKRIEIVARNERTGELICINGKERTVSLAEKILKILSYLIFPISLTALLLRYLLKKSLHQNTKLLFLDNSEPLSALSFYGAYAGVLRNKLDRVVPIADMSRFLANEGINLVHCYRDDENEALFITISTDRYPNLAFTFAIPIGTESLSPKTLQNKVMEHVWNCFKSLNVAHRNSWDRLVMSRPLCINFAEGFIIHENHSSLIHDKDLLRKDASNSPEQHNELQLGFNQAVKFAIARNYPTSALASPKNRVVVTDPAKNTLLPRIVAPGRSIKTYSSKDERNSAEANRIFTFLQSVHPEYLGGMIKQVPASILSQMTNKHKLISLRMRDVFDLSAPILDPNLQINDAEKRHLVGYFLKLLNNRILGVGENERLRVVFYKIGQSYEGGGDNVGIFERNRFGSLFFKPEGSQETTLGYSILQQLIAMGIFKEYVEHRDYIELLVN
ncbi:DUF648 domain-containing protein [Chlamydia vaughanii]|uniref:DUF648 domain-containing protein n=1 Tax=Chlamydia vaughanii TaxID=3112552 RepID=UPI0032B2B098